MKIMRILPRFRQAYRELKTLEQREQWSRAELDAYQLERLNAVWRHAVAHVPYYRELAAKMSLPPRFTSLDEYRSSVPVLSKSTIHSSAATLLSERHGRGQWYRTGGSTGIPLSTYWEFPAYREVLWSRYRIQTMWGLDIFARTALLWGHGASFGPGLAGRLARLRRPIEDGLRNRIRLSAYSLGPDELRRYLKRIQSFQPALIYAYSSSAYLLALEAERTGFRSDAIKLFTLTAEPVFPCIVERVERVFGVPAIVEYGSTECAVVAGEWTDRTLRVNEHTSLLETVPRDDGRYSLVVTVLNNPSFPLLRYATDDVTDAPLQKPERGFAILKNVAGRNNDFIVTRSGRFLHFARFDALFKYESPAIRLFRVRQLADGSVSVMLELDAGGTLDVPRLQHKVTELIEGYPVTVHIVDRMPQTVAGKHRLIVSELDKTLISARTASEEIAQPDRVLVELSELHDAAGLCAGGSTRGTPHPRHEDRQGSEPMKIGSPGR